MLLIIRLSRLYRLWLPFFFAFKPEQICVWLNFSFHKLFGDTLKYDSSLSSNLCCSSSCSLFHSKTPMPLICIWYSPQNIMIKGIWVEIISGSFAWSICSNTFRYKNIFAFFGETFLSAMKYFSFSICSFLNLCFASFCVLVENGLLVACILQSTQCIYFIKVRLHLPIVEGINHLIYCCDNLSGIIEVSWPIMRCIRKY